MKTWNETLDTILNNYWNKSKNAKSLATVSRNKREAISAINNAVKEIVIGKDFDSPVISKGAIINEFKAEQRNIVDGSK